MFVLKVTTWILLRFNYQNLTVKNNFKIPWFEAAFLDSLAVGGVDR